MKRMSFYLLSLLCFLCAEKTYSQVSQDSLWARSARSIKKQLQLSDSTAFMLLQIGQEQLRQTAVLNDKKDTSPDDRARALQQIQQRFHQQVQHLLTDEQWKGYKEREETMRTRFINNANDKKKPVKELGS